MNNLRKLIDILRTEQKQISKAISILENSSFVSTTGNGRRKKVRRKMSTAARARIAAAQRKRWKLWKAKQ